MRRQLATGFTLFLLFMGIVLFPMNIHPVAAHPGPIYIRADGRIDPSTANITTSDNRTYMFTGTVTESLIVERDHIVIDGKGFALCVSTFASIGIELASRSNVTVTNLGITAHGTGISLSSSSGNTICDNTITNAMNGIRLGSSVNNSISRNNIIDNGQGIHLGHISNSNIFVGNNFTNNIYGIFLGSGEGPYVHLYSYNNLLWGNNIQNNDYGIKILFSCQNNAIYHNNFINNTRHVLLASLNTWDNGIEGNYWSNYTGVDLSEGGDGIGDAPHVLDGSNHDNHPLMGPISFHRAGTWNNIPYSVHIISNSTLSDFHFNPDAALLTFNVTGSIATDGFCRVGIPQPLLSALPGEWVLVVNGTVVSFRVQQQANYSYLFFTYVHSTQNVQICGTTAIPEFSSSLLLPLLLMVLLLVLLSVKKERRESYSRTKFHKA